MTARSSVHRYEIVTRWTRRHRRPGNIAMPILTIKHLAYHHDDRDEAALLIMLGIIGGHGLLPTGGSDAI